MVTLCFNKCRHTLASNKHPFAKATSSSSNAVRLLLCILLLLIPSVSLRADEWYGQPTFGTYDESKRFVDVNNKQNICWIQPDGTVYISWGYRDPKLGNETFVTNSETYTVPETVTDSNGKVYTVSGLARAAFTGFSSSDANGGKKVTHLILPECCKNIDTNGGYFDLVQVDGPGVTRLGNSVFEMSQFLTTVNMPNLEIVGNSAFYCCYKLEAADFPKLKGFFGTGYRVFYACFKIKTLSFPLLKSFGAEFCLDCRSLETFSLPNATYFDEKGAMLNNGTEYFSGCESLKKIDLRSLVHIKNLFSGRTPHSQLTEVRLDNAVDACPEGLGNLSGIKTLSLPNFTNFVDANDPTKEVEFNLEGQKGIVRNGNNLEVLDMPKFHQTLTNNLVSNLQHLTTLRADSVTSVNIDGWGSKTLKSLYLPSATNFQANGAYFDNLSELNIQKVVKFIANSASMPSLESIDLPCATSFIANAANFPGLKKLSIPMVASPDFQITYVMMPKLEDIDISSVTQFNNYAGWDKGSGPAMLTTSNNIKRFACHDADVLRQFLAWHTIRGGGAITHDWYEQNAKSYDALETVVLASQTSAVDDNMFDKFPGIKHLIMQAGSTEYNGKAMSALTKLEDITVAGGNAAFSSVDGVLYDKTGNTLLYFPQANIGSLSADGTQRTWTLDKATGAKPEAIGPYAFYNYSATHQMIFADNLSAIDEHAFDGSHINRTFDPGTPLTTVTEYSFANMREPLFRYLRMPNAVTTIQDNAFINDEHLEALELYGTRLETVGDNAFKGLTTITSIALPATVTSIGSNAFEGNAAMTTFTVPQACTQIGSNAFAATALSTLVIPDYNAGMEASLDAAFGSDAATKRPVLLVPADDRQLYAGWQTKSSESVELPCGRYSVFSRNYPSRITSRLDGASRQAHIYRVDGSLPHADGDKIVYLNLVELSAADLSYVPANTALVAYMPGHFKSGTYTVTFNVLPTGSRPEWADGSSWLKGAPAAMRLDRYTDANGNATTEGQSGSSETFCLSQSAEFPAGIFQPVAEKDWTEQSTLYANECYLRIPLPADGAAIKAIRLCFNGVTDIDDIAVDGNSGDDGRWYRLDGSVLSGKPAAPGLYIHNKKKVVVK